LNIFKHHSLIVVSNHGTPRLLHELKHSMSPTVFSNSTSKGLGKPLPLVFTRLTFMLIFHKELIIDRGWRCG